VSQASPITHGPMVQWSMVSGQWVADGLHWRSPRHPRPWSFSGWNPATQNGGSPKAVRGLCPGGWVPVRCTREDSDPVSRTSGGRLEAGGWSLEAGGCTMDRHASSCCRGLLQCAVCQCRDAQEAPNAATGAIPGGSRVNPRLPSNDPCRAMDHPATLIESFEEW
jgi:hypothetical protein